MIEQIDLRKEGGKPVEPALRALPKSSWRNKKLPEEMLVENFIYWQRVNGVWHKKIIPRGFVFDGASVNFLIARLAIDLSTIPRWLFIQHDYDYWIQSESRSIADEKLRLFLKWGEVGLIRRNTIYKAVDWFGWLRWNERTKEIDKGIDVDYPFPKDLLT